MPRRATGAAAAISRRRNFLESGTDRRLTSGWLNRVVAALPKQPTKGETAVAVGQSMPLVLRGPGPVGTWLPKVLPELNVDLYARIAALNAHDPVTGPAIAAALRERGFSDAVLAGLELPKDRGAFQTLASEAGRLLAAADGPRIAALEIGGWDTHAAQGGRLAAPLSQLDAGLVALKQSMGDAWRHTAVLVMTEFGRTVRVNGTKGTDHGTGTVAFALGGAVAGGKVRANWPGLAPSNLFENRDLMPTTDLRAVLKTVMREHLRIPQDKLESVVFPNSGDARPMAGITASA
jgi:uncharacterized protein (DUF1501 family)